MTKHERNIRTLIVCFVLLVLGLVPLRFIEVGNLINESRTRVLGEEIVVEVNKVEKVDILLPNAEIDLTDLQR